MIDQLILYLKPLGIKLAYAGAFLVVGTLITRIIAGNISKQIIRDTPNLSTKNMARVVYNMISMGSFIILLLISVSIVGINISLLIGGVGLAIGYAMEEVLGNIFASIMIITHDKYHVGDVIKVQGDINVLGTIESVSTRMTSIRTFDKQCVMIPNLTMIRSPIIPYSKKTFARCQGTITIPRQGQIHLAREIITQHINNHPATTAPEYTTVLLSDHTEGGTQLSYYYYFNPSNEEGLGRFKYLSAINTAIYSAFQEHQIVVPYPHRLLETSKLS